MADISSELPIRTQLPGQANYDDVVTKMADGTTSTQLAAVDTHGSQQSTIADSGGNIVTSQANGAQRALDVGIDVAGVQIDPRQIRALTSADVVTAAQGSANTVANAWPIKVTDGTNTAAVKAASTAAAAADPSLVVAFSPNSPLPAGSATIGAVNQGTSPWIVKDQADGSVAPGTAGSFSQLAGAVYTSGGITLTTGQQAALQMTATGALLTSTVLTNDTNYGTVGANTLRTASQIGNATGAADFNNGATGAQTLRVAANLAVGGANVSGTNPVPVSFSSAPIGTPVNDYKTVSALAAGSADNHIYTITASKTFQGKMIWASASGLIKIEVRISPDGSTYTSKWVGFNSTATPNISINLDQMVFLESGAGSTIEVIVTNEDKKAMDVYSTISGTEV